MDDTEFKVPSGLLIAAIVILVGEALFTGGVSGALIGLLVVLIQVVFGVLVGIAACFATAKLLNTSFGLLHSAFLKMAAICTFPSAVAVLIPIPIVGWIISVITYFVLLNKLFELEFYESIAFVIILFIIQIYVLSLALRIVLAF